MSTFTSVMRERSWISRTSLKAQLRSIRDLDHEKIDFHRHFNRDESSKDATLSLSWLSLAQFRPWLDHTRFRGVNEDIYTVPRLLSPDLDRPQISAYDFFAQQCVAGSPHSGLVCVLFQIGFDEIGGPQFLDVLIAVAGWRFLAIDGILKERWHRIRNCRQTFDGPCQSPCIQPTRQSAQSNKDL